MSIYWGMLDLRNEYTKSGSDSMRKTVSNQNTIGSGCIQIAVIQYVQKSFVHFYTGTCLIQMDTQFTVEFIPNIMQTSIVT